METKVRERRKEAYILEADHSLVFLMLLLYQLQVSNLASVIKKLDENGLKYQLIWQVKKKKAAHLSHICPICGFFPEVLSAVSSEIELHVSIHLLRFCI